MTDHLILVILGLALTALSIGSVCRHKLENALLTLAVVAYFLCWLIIPAASALFFLASGQPLEPGFANIFFIESSCVFVGINMFLRTSISSAMPKLGSPKVKYFYLGVILDFIYLLSNSGGDYLTSNSIEYKVDDGVVPFLGQLLSGYMIYVALFSEKRIEIVISSSLVLYFCYNILASGGRLTLLLPLFIVVFRSLSSQSSSFKKYTLAFIAGLLLIFSINLSSYIEAGRGRGEALNDFKLSNQYASTLSVIGSAYQKFNSFSAGSQLIDGYGPGSAGLRPYLGSLLYPIPRVLFPEKPVSGSIYSDRSGVPSRLVPALINPRDTINNVGVSPLAISVWQWGWITGLIVFTATSILNLKIIQICIESQYLIMRILAITLIPLPGFLVFPSPDVVLKNLMTVLVFYVALTIFRFSQKELKH